MLQLCRGKIVVFDRVTRAEHFNMFKTRNALHCFILNIFRQRCAKPIHIDFHSTPTFRFDKNLMSITVCKTIDFILYARTISRTTRFNSPIKHWRAVKSCSKNIVGEFIGICNVTWALLGEGRGVSKTKFRRGLIAVLNVHFRIVKRTTIHTRGSSSLHSARLKPQLNQFLCNSK